MKILFLVIKSIIIGGANVMPGVSGATLAVIFRIYDKLIESINNLFSNMKESLKFLIPVGLSMVVGVLAVGRGVNSLLEMYSMQTGGFIAGLMAGSLPFIHSQAILELDNKKKAAFAAFFRRTKCGAPPTAAERKWALPTEARGFGGVAPIGDGNCESSFLAKNKATKYYFIAAFAAIVIILLALFTATENSYEAEGITLSATLAVHLFIGGLFSAAALVIPGISGAMVLMLFGLYAVATHTLSRISDFLMSPTDLEILTEILIIAVPLGLGIVAGILLGSKLIAMLLKKFHTATYFAILGLVLGTIFAIFNNPDTYQSHDEITPPLIAFTAIAFVCGAVASLLLGKKK